MFLLYFLTLLLIFLICQHACSVDHLYYTERERIQYLYIFYIRYNELINFWLKVLIVFSKSRADIVMAAVIKLTL